MTIYCDTSVLVSALSAEADSAQVQIWFELHRHDIAVSNWVVTEVSGALAMKRRMGVLSAVEWQEASSMWSHAILPGLDLCPVDAKHFRLAAALLDDPGFVLRSGDALHLAVADDAGCSIATLDHRFAVAAERRGLVVERIVEPA